MSVILSNERKFSIIQSKGITFVHRVYFINVFIKFVFVFFFFVNCNASKDTTKQDSLQTTVFIDIQGTNKTHLYFKNFSLILNLLCLRFWQVANIKY